MRIFHRVADFELCRIECRTNEPYPRLLTPGYTTRSVSCDEFHGGLSTELTCVDYRWAFDRGDLCTATLCEDEVVAYNFTTMLSTRVRDGLAFTFTDEFVYSFASLTAKSHRGNQLARECWQVARETGKADTGLDPPSVSLSTTWKREPRVLRFPITCSGDTPDTFG